MSVRHGRRRHPRREFLMSVHDVDCLVVGGGPAGLSAAIYISRFHLNALIVDSGDSRTALIPMTRNYPGFPNGIAGLELLRRMREQALSYGARYLGDEIVGLNRTA